MPSWKIATVQMDCKLKDRAANLEAIRKHLHEAAAKGAQLAVFPECAVAGYCYESKAEAMPFAETLPGPTTEALSIDCRQLGIWAVVGLLERDGDDLFNSCVLVGPDGFKASYRKTHLPCLGVDRFTTPGTRPFAVQDLGGLRIGMNICYDGSFPETARIFTLLGADLVVLPTNWPEGSISTITCLMPARALENHIFYAACNRVGEEKGFRFLGRSRIFNVNGELLAASEDDRATIVYADIDPAKARDKKVVRVPKVFELHRTNDRRPELYGPLTATERD
ncbi:MAG TPA: carbon-nitrogen hydrolase family protein [Gemmataceae bacterium]|nr:carbon-nitrogen hydrolase family protein [Gemmataceae bacterium]